MQEIKAVPGSSERNLPVFIDTKQGEIFMGSLSLFEGRNESLRRPPEVSSSRPEERQAALSTDGITQVALHSRILLNLKDRLKGTIGGAGLCVVVLCGWAVPSSWLGDEGSLSQHLAQAPAQLLQGLNITFPFQGPATLEQISAQPAQCGIHRGFVISALKGKCSGPLLEP